MTGGLLKSRSTKNDLYQKSLMHPTPAAHAQYKTFSNLYFKTIRAAKKLHYTKKLESNSTNVKKTWDTLNEILGRDNKSEVVTKINADGSVLTDPSDIAGTFNTFFTKIGTKISNSVQPVEIAPEDYINYGREIPSMSQGNTTPEHVNVQGKPKSE